MKLLLQSTAVTVGAGPFNDPSTGLPVTGADIDQADVILVKNNNWAGAAQKNDATANAAHVAGAVFKITIDATDTNTLGPLEAIINLSADANTPMVVREYFGMVVPANVYNSVVLGTDVLDVSAIQILGGAIPAVTVTGVPKVDVAYLLGTAHLAPGTAGTPDVNTKLAGGTAWGSGAITAAALATDAVTEIVDAVFAALGGFSSSTFAAGSTVSALKLNAGELDLTDRVNQVTGIILSGAAIGQVFVVSNWNNGTKTVTPLDDTIAAPGAGDTYRLFATPFSDTAATIVAALIASIDAGNSTKLEAIRVMLTADNVTAPSAPPASNAPVAQRIAWLLAEKSQKAVADEGTGVENVYATDGTTVIGTRTVTKAGDVTTRPAYS